MRALTTSAPGVQVSQYCNVLRLVKDRCRSNCYRSRLAPTLQMREGVV
jgi:hypothetical protein